MNDPTDDTLPARLDEYADPDLHECSDVGNFAGGYDCECGWSGWYTHLSYPPYKGCMAQYVMQQAASRIRALEAAINEHRNAPDILRFHTYRAGDRFSAADYALYAVADASEETDDS